MALYFLLALCFFHLVCAQANTSYCPFDQGLVDFCRIDSELTLRLPIHAEMVFLTRIENSALAESIPLHTALAKCHVVPKLASAFQSTPGCKFEPGETNFVRFMNISDRNIPIQDWYVACADYNVVDVTYKRADGESSEIAEEKRRWIEVPSPGYRSGGGFTPEKQKCIRCAMIKDAQLDAPSDKFLQSSWVKDRLDSSILRYTSSDLPFESIKLFGKVIDLDARRQVFQFRQLIKSRQQMFIRLPRIDEEGRYAVVTDFYPQKNGSNLMFYEDFPLVLQDYIRLEPVDENVVGTGDKGGKQNRLWFQTPNRNLTGRPY